jgi:hypothetical protein
MQKKMEEMEENRKDIENHMEKKMDENREDVEKKC